MSKRRSPGDWVRLGPNSGFVGDSDRLRAEIQDDGFEGWCLLECADSDCREWVTLLTEPDPQAGGQRHMLCHVSECQMHDCDTPPSTIKETTP